MMGLNEAQYATAVSQFQAEQRSEEFEFDDIFQFAAAALTDTVLSTLDSITFGAFKEELDTSESLHWMNEDLGDYYDNHKDGIELASFVGGMVIPGVAAAKAFKYAKRGNTILGRSVRRTEAQRAKAIKGVQEEGVLGTQYRDAMRSIRYSTLGQGVAEGMVYEASFILFNGQHPYMENEYDIADFALGAGLGALAGPARLIGSEFSMRKTVLPIMAAIDANKIKGGRFHGPDQGIRASYLGVQISKMEKQEALGYQGLSSQAQREAGEELTATYSMLGRDIRAMMTDELAAIKPPKGDKQRFGSYTNGDIFQTDPANILGEVAARGDGALVGVGIPGKASVREFSDAVDVDGLVGKIYKSDDLNQIHSIDRGGNAALIFMNKYIGRKTEGLEWPTNLDTKVESGRIRVLEATGPLSNNDLTYIANKLASDWKDVPLELRGEELYKLKASRAQAQGLVELELNLGTKFISEADMVEKYANPSQIPNAGVINPYFGPNVIGEIEALANLTASMSTGTKVRGKLKLKDKLIYGTKDSTAITDAGWIEGIQWAMDIRWGAGTKLDPGEVFKVQGLTRRYLEQSLKEWHPVTIGDTVLGNVDEALDYLWVTKRKIVNDITSIEIGGSSKQAAIKANLPLKETELIVQNADLPRGSLQLSQYEKLIPEVYSSYKGIKLSGESIRVGQKAEANAAAFADLDTMQKVSDTHVQAAIATSRIPEVKELQDLVIFSDSMLAIRDMLPQVLVNLGDKKNLWTSSDQVLRSLPGGLGDMITILGKDLGTITNRLYKRHQIALEGPAAAVSRDAVSSTQYSMLRQTLQTLGIKDAQKLQYDETLGKIGRLVKDEETGEMVIGDYLKFTGTDSEIVFTPQMKIWAESYQDIMHEHLDLLNVSKSIWGKPTSKGAGFWLPYEDLSSKLVAFKVGKHGKTGPSDITMIVANNAKELDSLVLKHQAESGHAYDFVFRDTSKGGAAYNWADYHQMAEFGEIKKANLNLEKKGIAVEEIVPGSADIDNLLPDLQANLWNHMRNITKASNSNVFDQLAQATKSQTQAAESGAGFLKEQIQRKVSTPEVAEKVLLNKSQLSTQPLMDMTNNWVGAQMNGAIHKGAALFREAKGKEAHIKDWIKLDKDLKEAGIPNPWEDAYKYASAVKQVSGRGDIATHRVAQAQSILVSMNLKLLELSHAAVTLFSMPVVLSAETKFLTDKGFMGINKLGIDAAKFMFRNNDESKRIMDFGDKMHYTEGVVSELSALMRDLPTNAALGKKYDKTIRMLSSASNGAENLSRAYSYALGYLIAKQKHPTSSMRLLATEAAAFTNRTMGNYTARQKPVLFQGSFGTMIGLYQTFMLTMGQNLFRYAEKGHRKAIAQLMGTQAAVFGLESLPFFNDFNRMIGEYASDEHNDLITTTYNVFGNNEDQSRSMAEFMLFGLPSTTFGTAIYTRATLDPRTPFGFSKKQGFSVQPPVVDAIMQGFKVTSTTIQDMYKTGQTGGNIYDMGQVALQGLAAQSLWRPGARYAEMLGLGKSFDQKGEVISNTEDIQEPFALMARAIGARPLKEQALRNLKFNTSFYNGIDKDRNAKVKKQVRRLVADESSDLSELDNLFGDYIDNGGKYQGWKSVLNGAYMESSTPFAFRLHEQVEKQPAIAEIAETYGY